MARIELMEPTIRTIKGKRFDSKTAEVVAHGSFLGGYRGDHLGRYQILYKTKKGDFFMFHETNWEDELDCLEPVSFAEAEDIYHQLLCPEMEYHKAFGSEPE